MLEMLPGHPRVKKLLTKLLYSPPSALLFGGPRGVGKARFARTFAQALLSQGEDLSPQSQPLHHFDLRQLYPEGKMYMHSMEAIKELVEQVLLPPFKSRRKVFIIHEADRMLPHASNALLKTLEEPPTYAHLILLSSRPEAILSTVLSRLLSVPFFSLSRDALATHVQEHWGKSSQEARHIAWLAHGNLKSAEALAKGGETSFLPLVVEMGMAALQEKYALLFCLLSELSLFAQKSHFETVEGIFTAIYYWYRDVHLLRVGGDRSLLFFQQYEERLQEAVRFSLPELVEVQKRMGRAIYMWEAMNTAFRCCLAYLFIF